MRAEGKPIIFRGLIPFCVCLLLTGCATVPTGRHQRGALVLSEDEHALAQAMAHYSAGLIADRNGTEGKQAAQSHYVQALKLDPDRAVLIRHLAHSAVRTGDLTKAIAILEESCRLQPDNADVHMELAATYQLSGRLTDALQTFRKALTCDPSLNLPYMAIAGLQFSARAYAAAFETLAEGLQNTKKPRPLLHLCHQQGARMLRDRDIPRAISCFEFVAEHEPTQRAELYHIIAEIHRSQENTDKARHYYELSTRNPDAPPEAYVRLALLQHGTDPEQAIATLTEGVMRIPGNAHLLQLLGQLHREKGKTDKAIALLKKAVEQDPPLPNAYITLAMLHLEDNPPESLRVMEEAARRLPGHATVLLLLANMYSIEERLEEAVPLFERVRKLAKTDNSVVLSQEFFLHFGATCERAGRLGQAETVFIEGLQEYPDAHQILNYVAYMWAERAKNLPQALKNILRALELQPDSGAYIDTLGWVYYQQERYAESLEQLEKAVVIIDDDPVLLDHLGDVLHKLGDEKRAIDYWKRSFRIDPSNESVRDKLTANGINTNQLSRPPATDSKEHE